MNIHCFLFGMPGPYELIFIFLIILLIFGASRLPEIGKQLGKGIREFKKAGKELTSSEEDKEKKDEQKNP